MDKNPTAEQVAAIAVQFITAGDDQAEALRKANALYFAARDYLREFAEMSADDKARVLYGEKAMLEMADRENLALGDSEENSPALKYFREIAKTKLEQNISHSAFLTLMRREYGRPDDKGETVLPEKVMRWVLENLHDCLRVKRSQARSKRRKK